MEYVFRALRTWSSCVADGAAALRSFAHWMFASLLPALRAVGSIPSPAKNTSGISTGSWPGEVGSRRAARKNSILLDAVFVWYPAATYLSGPSPAKYCRRIRA